MEGNPSFRRRFLQLGALGIATSIAGCAGNDPDPSEYTDPHENNTDPDDDVDRFPDIPPAGFKGHSTEFTFQDEDRELWEDIEDAKDDKFVHPDQDFKF